MTTNSASEECEDIPSDFFDDFNKDEFMEGLSVIDSWGGDQERPKKSSRIDFETVDTVKDLRELIHSRDDSKRSRQSHEDIALNLDEYIKPGSRRDPNKTKEAIKRDKEIKVKQYLAKSLDATEDLRPPGTELDDYFEEAKAMQVKKHKIEDEEPVVPRKRSSRERPEHVLKEKYEQIQDYSPRDRPEQLSRERRGSRERRDSKNIHSRLGVSSLYDKRRRSPPKRSPARRSPRRGSPRRSPRRGSPRRSPRRGSPRRSPARRYNRMKSPIELRRTPHRYERRSRSRSLHREIRRSPRRERSRSRGRDSLCSRNRDSFLYPSADQAGVNPYPENQYQPPPFVNMVPEYTTAVPNPYFQPDMYNGGYVQPSYDYGAPVPGMGLPMAPIPQPVPPMLPQPVPAPVMAPVAAPILNSVPPPMVAEPTMLGGIVQPQISPSIPDMSKQNPLTPFDALAKLVADGKLSKEDYLKLAPNKGKSASKHGAFSSMDAKARVDVLSRCHEALSKLTTLRLPNTLVLSANMAEEKPKPLAPKYCSPLKRQVEIEFQFTKSDGTAHMQNNKQVLESIVSTLGLNNLIAKSKRKGPKNMRDAGTQTTKPYCDLCEVRDATNMYDNSTSTDPRHFTSTIHTQVVEQDLMSSKAVFGAPGGGRETGPVSIAHLTPAQLVSQLAARAKSLKGPDGGQPPPQYPRRPPQDNYDPYGRGGGGGSGQYQNYNNYRY